MLADAGAFLVGADVLHPPYHPWHYCQLDSFLQQGVDWGSDGYQQLLLEAARLPMDHSIHRFLTHGFVDVDARDGNHMTQLMHVASIDPELDLHPHSYDQTDSAGWQLMQYSDCNAVDNLGRTALHYAAAKNDRMMRMLLKHGVDASILDHNGMAAHDFYDAEDTETLWAFLRCGADLFASVYGDSSQLSLYDRLAKTHQGQRIVCEHFETAKQY